MRILLLNQCFHPDHVSTSQHLTDLALELVAQGHEVNAIASSRGYDNPSIRFPAREVWCGIHIRRIWTPGLGKKSKLRRIVDFLFFWFNATRLLLFLPRQDVTVCLTSPPLVSALGTLMSAIKGGAVVSWVMDLNPDEAVAAGWLKQGSLMERLLSAIQGASFRHTSKIIALDHFMADRLAAKGVTRDTIHVDAPWSHDQAVSYDAQGRQTFRVMHGLADKFVVMYSGNHSPCHPLDTILSAAEQLSEDSRVHFLFIGGGSEFSKVRNFAAEKHLANITCLPYQPIEKLSASLSSADLHLVVMGDPFVGIVHPCKIYNILNLGLPFLFVGPEKCHVTELAARITSSGHAHLARHGEVERVAETIRHLARSAANPQPDESAMQLGAEFSQHVLCPRLARIVAEAAGRLN